MIFLLIALILLSILTEFQLYEIMINIKIYDKKYYFYHTVCSVLRIIWISLCAWLMIQLPIFLIGLLVLLLLNVVPYHNHDVAIKNITIFLYLLYISLLMLSIGLLGMVGIDLSYSLDNSFLRILVLNLSFIFYNFVCFILLKYYPEFLWDNGYDHFKVIIYTRFLMICILYNIIDAFVLEYYQMQQIEYLLLLSGDLLILFLMYYLSNYNYVFIKSEIIRKDYEQSEILMAQQYFEKQKLKHLSEHDTLTKAYSRREVCSIMEERIQKGDELICVFIDLDGLKILNDTYGHSFGDLVLMRFANACIESFLDIGYVARIGGDEFLLVFFNQKLDYIKERMRSLQTSLQNGENHISFSYGISYQEKSVEDYIMIADQKMYDDKHRKRRDNK
ncbi:GGDEF domain-containing protein [Candidatus Stoquefichus massiliensis]|uniref:GGDEF domain-containing protein n=1 Tax=Candidatus Stoquefichus massiliensis TaxID=1470350 RepID=UPI000481289F|nr:GGDEF domain-containing protein [Candidatus Stoquefichus massiliensis]